MADGHDHRRAHVGIGEHAQQLYESLGFVEVPPFYFNPIPGAHYLRADLTVEHVTVSGFDLVFRTWGDTRIARLRVDWMAIGAMRDDDDWDVG